MSFRVSFQGHGQAFDAGKSLRLTDAAAACDLVLEHPCGARGSCGKCRVRFLAGAPEPSAVEQARLDGAELAAGWRLACRVTLTRAAHLWVPPTGRARAARCKGLGPSGPLEPPFVGQLEGLGWAADLGSTSLTLGLVELETGRVLASETATNPQVALGADLMTRVAHAREERAGAAELASLLRKGLGLLAADLLARAGREADEIVAALLAGNAVQQCCAAGLDPSPFGDAPYEGPGASHQSAEACGLPARGGARASFLPVIGGLVGGDTVAALIATGVDLAGQTRALVDLGTNSEVVVGDRDGLVVASAAAGPAFEGASIAQGMRAVEGAIHRVSIDPDRTMRVQVLGGGNARGLCGTGLVDAVAACVELGEVEPSGRMPTGRVELAPGVALLAADVRELQLVKASIRAALELCCAERGIGCDELDAVHVCGAFGGNLRKESALAIGLLPEIDAERIRLAGNAAGLGVRLALADRDAAERAEAIATRARHVELASQASYHQVFADAIAFPAPEAET